MKSFPHPPTLSDVIAFGSDLAVMHQVDSAVTSLVERLVPWGGPRLTKLEWVVAARAQGSEHDFDLVPTFMGVVLKPLCEAMGIQKGWVARGQRAWKEGAFSSRPDPFEPLLVIMGAGYRVVFGAEAVRLSCDG